MYIIIRNELFINVSLREREEPATKCINVKVTKLPLDLNANPENREQKGKELFPYEPSCFRLLVGRSGRVGWFKKT